MKKRFHFNQHFQQEYVKYINIIIACTHAEQIPEDQRDLDNGRVWYIPHHGVHHPRKGTLCVVFDCGATFVGVSLNVELLQGPNLTSTLLGGMGGFALEKWLSNSCVILQAISEEQRAMEVKL